MVEWGLDLLWRRSTKSMTASLASRLVAKAPGWHVSFLGVPKRDSATALSRQQPVRPHESLASWPAARPAGARPMWVEPLSLRSTAPPAAWPRAHARAGAESAGAESLPADIDRPTTTRVARSTAVCVLST